MCGWCGRWVVQNSSKEFAHTKNGTAGCRFVSSGGFGSFRKFFVDRRFCFVPEIFLLFNAAISPFQISFPVSKKSTTFEKISRSTLLLVVNKTTSGVMGKAILCRRKLCLKFRSMGRLRNKRTWTAITLFPKQKKPSIGRLMYTNCLWVTATHAAYLDDGTWIRLTVGYIIIPDIVQKVNPTKEI